jgi:transcriptional regulator with XRE-family HTH domain
LRAIREEHQLTLKDVERRSRQIAESRHNPEYLFTAGRLSQVENSSSLPSLYKLATLSEIYEVPYAELLNVFGIEVDWNGLSTSLGERAPAQEPKPVLHAGRSFV